MNLTEKGLLQHETLEIEVMLTQPTPDEEISLTSSEETEAVKPLATDDSAAKKSSSQDSSMSWEMRESIEITLTAQPEDTVTAEERLDIAEVLSLQLFLV